MFLILCNARSSHRVGFTPLTTHNVFYCYLFADLQIEEYLRWEASSQTQSVSTELVLGTFEFIDDILANWWVSNLLHVFKAA